MKTKRLTPEKIKQIHEMLDDGKTIKQVMDALDVSLRQVSYQASFRPKKPTISQLAEKAGVKLNAIMKRKQSGMTLEQALNHKKWAKYEVTNDN